MNRGERYRDICCEKESGPIYTLKVRVEIFLCGDKLRGNRVGGGGPSNRVLETGRSFRYEERFLVQFLMIIGTDRGREMFILTKSNELRNFMSIYILFIS